MDGRSSGSGDPERGTELQRRLHRAIKAPSTATARPWRLRGVPTPVSCRKQRTAIARALMVDPVRILILDDALSAVDTYTEEEILSRLRETLRQRTSIIVSHRISTVRDADLIVVLDRGRVVERGTHDGLLARDGLYANLFKKQLLEAELDAS